MKVIETDNKIDGRFLLTDDEVPSFIYIFDKLNKFVDYLSRDIESTHADNQSNDYLDLCTTRDMIIEHMTALSLARWQDGLFLLTDDEARSFLYTFDKLNKFVDYLSCDIESTQADNQAKDYLDLCITRDTILKHMTDLSLARWQVWAFDFETDQDSI